jgi:hypothetical protein
MHWAKPDTTQDTFKQRWEKISTQDTFMQRWEKISGETPHPRRGKKDRRQFAKLPELLQKSQ